ncbi:hypothetical protein NC653_031964 [Populus alba x Populus x berolinensis]|uniref:Uncharacterized protein n=1 Tax=Populus alba x Populus x berolinensis TaxID=444605 RepID=A0AAD6LZR6_9ROSI|nr:hypothetical protein NC653_031964 [Populus alba x Populus x berolinensis]
MITTLMFLLYGHLTLLCWPVHPLLLLCIPLRSILRVLLPYHLFLKTSLAIWRFLSLTWRSSQLKIAPMMSPWLMLFWQMNSWTWTSLMMMVVTCPHMFLLPLSRCHPLPPPLAFPCHPKLLRVTPLLLLLLQMLPLSPILEVVLGKLFFPPTPRLFNVLDFKIVLLIISPKLVPCLLRISYLSLMSGTCVPLVISRGKTQASRL